MNKRLLILFTAALLTAGACKKKENIPDHIIQPELYTSILMDVILAEANEKLARRNGADIPNLLDSSYAYIFEHHNVSWETVDTSFKYYNAHPHALEEITGEVLKRLHQLEQTEASEPSEQTDSTANSQP